MVHVGQYNDGISWLEYVVGKKPGDVKARSDLAVAYAYAGRPNDAWAQYQAIQDRKRVV